MTCISYINKCNTYLPSSTYLPIKNTIFENFLWLYNTLQLNCFAYNKCNNMTEHVRIVVLHLYGISTINNNNIKLTLTYTV